MKIKYSFSPHIDYSYEWVLNAPLDEQSIADFIPVISQHFSRAEARRGRGVRAAFNARRHPLVLPCQTLITGNKLENRDCHNPENESGVSSERRCRLSRSRPRYLVTLMPTASAAPSWESTKAAGRVLYLELACLRIIDFLLIGYPGRCLLPSVPLQMYPATSLTDHYTTRFRRFGPCSRTGSNGRAALRVPLAACN